MNPLRPLRDKRHWIFDMDGTLTHAVHDFEAIKKTLGLPADLAILEALAQLPPAQAADKRRQLDALELDIASLAVAQPGAEHLLATLRDRGARVGILTRNGKAIAHATLAACGLADYFEDAAIISRDCCEPKPHPAGIRRLLHYWRGDRQSTVMVGDFRFDLEAGRAAGVTTVHLDVDGEFDFPWCTDIPVTSLEQLAALY